MVQAVQFRGSPEGKVVQTSFNLPLIRPDEVLVRVTHSGVCGSDIHMITKPLVLGHEGVGIIEEVRSACSLFKVGDRVGWGPIGSTCGHCEQCMAGKDAYCPEARNYGAFDFDTQGSICSYAVRKEQWIFHIPDSIPSEDAAPLMCGGGTFAAKMGCDVVALSSSEDKRQESMALGASEFYATRGVSGYSTLGITKPIDRLLITSSAKFDLGIFYPILARNARILPLSVDSGEITAPYLPTLLYGHEIIGSCVCSRHPQNKMLDFVARHGIHSIVEKFPMTVQGVQAAMDRLAAGKMRYRGVISWDY
ncbi:NADP-dependent alcohol dehydrogenase [Lojkania enalia]|uniref:NADP-dependent alcohol dehydrogenase n=1 Tax=Lojkania enalia TaxID=147567 RepID=A0A9P4NAU0_9PLEO|nr:NADP-dependent alcohol dehydrogenase [Didymosphaeria enalia]